MESGSESKVYSNFYEVESTRNLGYFATTEGQDNLLRNTLSIDAEVKTSGIANLDDVDDPASEMISRGLLGG